MGVIGSKDKHSVNGDMISTSRAGKKQADGFAYPHLFQEELSEVNEKQEA